MMLHEVRMRAFLLVPACLFLLWLTSAAACPEGEAAPRYSNSRFGFSLSWLPGHGTAREADNGDGVTVRDDQGFVLLAYGTRGYAVMGQRMEDAVAELSQGLEVSRRDCDTERGWCALSGVEGTTSSISCVFLVMMPPALSICAIRSKKRTSMPPAWKRCCGASPSTIPPEPLGMTPPRRPPGERLPDTSPSPALPVAGKRAPAPISAPRTETGAARTSRRARSGVFPTE